MTADRSDFRHHSNPHTLPAVLGLQWACAGAMALFGGWFVVAFCSAWCLAFCILGLRWKQNTSAGRVPGR
jgi:hypothetical protein